MYKNICYSNNHCIKLSHMLSIISISLFKKCKFNKIKIEGSFTILILHCFLSLYSYTLLHTHTHTHTHTYTHINTHFFSNKNRIILYTYHFITNFLT